MKGRNPRARRDEGWALIRQAYIEHTQDADELARSWRCVECVGVIPDPHLQREAKGTCSPPISVATLRLLSRETVSLPSLRYLATIPGLVTGPKLLNLPDGAALSFML